MVLNTIDHNGNFFFVPLLVLMSSVYREGDSLCVIDEKAIQEMEEHVFYRED